MLSWMRILTISVTSLVLLSGCVSGDELTNLFRGARASSLAEANAPANSSFCQAYQRVIRSDADSTAVKTLARTSAAVAKRTAANDTLYRCQCESWSNPVCEGKK